MFNKIINSGIIFLIFLGINSCSSQSGSGGGSTGSSGIRVGTDINIIDSIQYQALAKQLQSVQNTLSQAELKATNNIKDLVSQMSLTVGGLSDAIGQLIDLFTSTIKTIGVNAIDPTQALSLSTSLGNLNTQIQSQIDSLYSQIQNILNTNKTTGLKNKSIFEAIKEWFKTPGYNWIGRAFADKTVAQTDTTNTPTDSSTLNTSIQQPSSNVQVSISTQQIQSDLTAMQSALTSINNKVTNTRSLLGKYGDNYIISEVNKIINLIPAKSGPCDNLMQNINLLKVHDLVGKTTSAGKQNLVASLTLLTQSSSSVIADFPENSDASLQNCKQNLSEVYKASTSMLEELKVPNFQDYFSTASAFYSALTSFLRYEMSLEFASNDFSKSDVTGTYNIPKLANDYITALQKTYATGTEESFTTGAINGLVTNLNAIIVQTPYLLTKLGSSLPEEDSTYIKSVQDSLIPVAQNISFYTSKAYLITKLKSTREKLSLFALQAKSAFVDHLNNLQSPSSLTQNNNSALTGIISQIQTDIDTAVSKSRAATDITTINSIDASMQTKVDKAYNDMFIALSDNSDQLRQTMLTTQQGLQKNLDDANTSINSLKSQAKDLNDQLSAKTGDVTLLQTKLDAVNAALVQTQSDKVSIESKLQTTQSALNDLNIKYTTDITSLQSANKVLNDQLNAQFTSDGSALVSAMDQLNIKINQNKALIATNTTQITNLQNDLTKINDELNIVSNLLNSNDDFTTKLSNFNTTILNVKNNLVSQAQARSNAINVVNNLSVSLAQAQSEYKKQDTILSDFKNQLANAVDTNIIDSLNQQIVNQTTVVNNAQKTQNDAALALQTAQSNYTTLDNQFNALTYQDQINYYVYQYLQNVTDNQTLTVALTSLNSSLIIDKQQININIAQLQQQNSDLQVTQESFAAQLKSNSDALLKIQQGSQTTQDQANLILNLKNSLSILDGNVNTIASGFPNCAAAADKLNCVQTSFASLYQSSKASISQITNLKSIVTSLTSGAAILMSKVPNDFKTAHNDICQTTLSDLACVNSYIADREQVIASKNDEIANKTLQISQLNTQSSSLTQNLNQILSTVNSISACQTNTVQNCPANSNDPNSIQSCAQGCLTYIQNQNTTQSQTIASLNSQVSSLSSNLAIMTQNSIPSLCKNNISVSDCFGSLNDNAAIQKCATSCLTYLQNTSSSQSSQINGLNTVLSIVSANSIPALCLNTSNVTTCQGSLSDTTSIQTCSKDCLSYLQNLSTNQSSEINNLTNILSTVTVSSIPTICKTNSSITACQGSLSDSTSIQNCSKSCLTYLETSYNSMSAQITNLTNNLSIVTASTIPSTCKTNVSITSCQGSLSDANSVQTCAQACLTYLQSQYSSLNSTLSNYQGYFSNVYTALQNSSDCTAVNTSNKCPATSGDYNSIQNCASSCVNYLQTQNTTLKSNINTLNTTIANYESYFSSIYTSLQGSSATCTSANTSNNCPAISSTDYNSIQKCAQSCVSYLQGQYTALSSQVSSLNATVNGYKNNLQNIYTTLQGTSMCGTGSSVTGCPATSSSDAASIQTCAQNCVSSLQTQYTNNQTTITNLNNTISSLNANLQSIFATVPSSYYPSSGGTCVSGMTSPTGIVSCMQNYTNYLTTTNSANTNIINTCSTKESAIAALFPSCVSDATYLAASTADTKATALLNCVSSNLTSLVPSSYSTTNCTGGITLGQCLTNYKTYLETQNSSLSTQVTNLSGQLNVLGNTSVPSTYTSAACPSGNTSARASQTCVSDYITAVRNQGSGYRSQITALQANINSCLAGQTGTSSALSSSIISSVTGTVSGSASVTGTTSLTGTATFNGEVATGKATVTLDARTTCTDSGRVNVTNDSIEYYTASQGAFCSDVFYTVYSVSLNNVTTSTTLTGTATVTGNTSITGAVTSPSVILNKSYCPVSTISGSNLTTPAAAL